MLVSTCVVYPHFLKSERRFFSGGGMVQPVLVSSWMMQELFFALSDIGVMVRVWIPEDEHIHQSLTLMSILVQATGVLIFVPVPTWIGVFKYHPRVRKTANSSIKSDDITKIMKSMLFNLSKMSLIVFFMMNVTKMVINFSWKVIRKYTPNWQKYRRVFYDVTEYVQKAYQMLWL